MMTLRDALLLGLGVFIGNWLVCPLIFKERTFKDGFAIGLIAFFLVVATFWVITRFTK
jgi:hypothetical protein